MGYIYKISNNINSKVYIGQTTRTIQERFSEHKNFAKNGSNFLIHKNMRKNGIENFFVEKIEECPNNLLDNRERYWIQYYNSYYNGYNATTGGNNVLMQKALPNFEQVYQDYVIENKTVQQIAKKYDICDESVRKILKRNGIQIKKKSLYNYKEVAQSYELLQNERAVCDKFQCSAEVVKRACKKYNIKILSAEESVSKNCSRKVYQIDIKSNNVIKVFDSFTQAGIAMGDKSKAMNISACCNGKQKTAYGYRWSYSKNFDKKYVLNDKKKKVIQINKDTGENICTFDCVADAAEDLSGSRNGPYSCSIAACARGEIKTAYGFKWQYEKG